MILMYSEICQTAISYYRGNTLRPLVCLRLIDFNLVTHFGEKSILSECKQNVCSIAFRINQMFWVFPSHLVKFTRQVQNLVSLLWVKRVGATSINKKKVFTGWKKTLTSNYQYSEFIKYLKEICMKLSFMSFMWYDTFTVKWWTV